MLELRGSLGQVGDGSQAVGVPPTAAVLRTAPNRRRRRHPKRDVRAGGAEVHQDLVLVRAEETVGRLDGRGARQDRPGRSGGVEVPEGRVVEESAVEPRVTEGTGAQVRSGEGCLGQGRAVETGASEVGPVKLRPHEVGVGEVGVASDNGGEIGFRDVSAAEVSAGERGAASERESELSAGQIRAVEPDLG